MELWDLLFQYHGIDWIVNSAALSSIVLLGNKHPAGFLVGMIAASFGIIFSIQIHSIPNGVTSLIFVLVNMRGYFLWHHNEEIQPIRHVPLSRVIPE